VWGAKTVGCQNSVPLQTGPIRHAIGVLKPFTHRSLSLQPCGCRKLNSVSLQTWQIPTADEFAHPTGNTPPVGERYRCLGRR
jgi:hypothetical protein